MKIAQSGIRGVYWRLHPGGSQVHPVTKKRGDWWIRWHCGFGHRHREKIGPRALARDEYAKRKLRVRAENYCPKRAATAPKPGLFDDAIEEFLGYSKANKRSYCEDKRLSTRLKAQFGGKLLDDITSGEVERWKARLKELKLAEATVNRHLALLKSIFNLAIRSRKTRENPVRNVRLFIENNARVRYLRDDEREEEKLFKVIPEPDGSLCLVALHTGMRQGELLALTRDRIDYANDVITIDRSKHGEKRQVPMNSVVRETLRRVLAVLGDPRVFPGCRDIVHRFPKYVEKAGLVDFRFHDLRHTFASRLAMAGVDLLTIKELGGWKTLAMVQRYAHLSPGHQRQAVERLVNRLPVLQKDTGEAPAPRVAREGAPLGAPGAPALAAVGVAR
jgi:integrase